MAKFCTNCGAPLRENMRFCVACGAQVKAAQPQNAQPAQPQYAQPAQPQYARPSQPQFAQPSQPQSAQPYQPQSAQPSQPRSGKRKKAAVPAGPAAPAQRTDAGFPPGAALCAAFLCVGCLPYLLKSLVFLLVRDSLGSLVCMILELASAAAAAAILTLGSKKAAGKANLPFAVLLAALLPGVEAADSLLASRINLLAPLPSLICAAGVLALRLVAAGLAVWAIGGLFVPASAARRGGKFLPWLCALAGFFAPGLVELLWELSPFDDAVSFFATFAIKALPAFLTSCAFTAAAALLLRNRPKARAKVKKTGPLPLIAGLALAVLSATVSLIDNARVPVLEAAREDVLSCVVDAEMYLNVGDMNGALNSYSFAAEHCNAWQTAAKGEVYSVPQGFGGDSTLLYLSFVNDDADQLRQYLAKNFDADEVSLWCPLMIRKYREKAEHGRLSKYERTQLSEMVRLCIAEECFIFGVPTAEEIQDERDALLEEMHLPEEYHAKMRMAEAVDRIQRGSVSVSEGVGLILGVAEEYPEELVFQYMAAAIGSENRWDGAGHYDRTAEAIERYRSLWLKEYGQDASSEERAELDSSLAEMLVRIQRYEQAIPLLENALSLAPDDTAVMQQLAFCYSSNNDTEKGYTLSKRLYAAEGDDVGVIWSYCVGALKHGENAEAIEAASRMADLVRTKLDGNQNHADEVLFNLVLYLGISDNSSWTDYQYRLYDDTRTDPELLSLLERNEFLYNYVRAVYWERDRSFPDEALPFAQKALSMQEDSGRLWYLNAMVYYDLGEFEQALECYRKADRLEPDDPSILFGLANTYDALEDYQTAYDYCVRALAHFPAGVDHSYDNYGVSWHASALLNRLKPYVEVND